MAAAISIQHDIIELTGNPSLFAQSWRPDSEIRGVLGIVHGLGEHSTRYTPLAERFAQAGVRVVTYDQRGHGRTDGRRGDAPSYDVLLDDIEALLDEMNAGHRSLPKFLFGQSFGGSLVLNLALRRRPRLHGIIASSPMLLAAHPPSQWKQTAARVLRHVWPSFQFRTRIQAKDLSHDPAMVAAHKADAMVHGLVTARVAVAMFDAGEWALQHAAELNIPTLLMHGTADAITSSDASIDFANRAGGCCTLRTFPGLYHELHWERERDAIFEVVLDWILQRVESSKSRGPRIE